MSGDDNEGSCKAGEWAGGADSCTHAQHADCCCAAQRGEHYSLVLHTVLDKALAAGQRLDALLRLAVVLRRGKQHRGAGRGRRCLESENLPAGRERGSPAAQQRRSSAAQQPCSAADRTSGRRVPSCMSAGGSQNMPWVGTYWRRQNSSSGLPSLAASSLRCRAGRGGWTGDGGQAAAVSTGQQYGQL